MVTDSTTIKVTKPIYQWLSNLKGVSDYVFGLNSSWNDFMLQVCALAEVYYAQKIGIIDGEFESEEAGAHLRRRIDMYFKDGEYEPTIGFFSAEDVWDKERSKKDKKSSKTKIT